MKDNPFHLPTPASIMARIAGLRIISGRETEDGLLLELEGNQTLAFTGAMIVGIHRHDEVSLH